MRYPNASTEPLEIIRVNECEADQAELATRRFQAFWNEIERLGTGDSERDREAFEAWLRESGTHTDWSRDLSVENGPYLKPLVQRTWQAWQAACAHARRS